MQDELDALKNEAPKLKRSQQIALEREQRRTAKYDAKHQKREEERAGRKLLVDMHHPALSAVAAPVPHGTNVMPIVNKMLLAIKATDLGVGLAANQIGELQRIIVLWSGRCRLSGDTHNTVMINPEYTYKSADMVPSMEGCLSVAAGSIVVGCMRHHSVTIRYYTPDWVLKEHSYMNFDAFVCQHELDHLDGLCVVKSFRETRMTPEYKAWRDDPKNQKPLSKSPLDYPPSSMLPRRPRPSSNISALLAASMAAMMGGGGGLDTPLREEKTDQEKIEELKKEILR